MRYTNGRVYFTLLLPECHACCTSWDRNSGPAVWLSGNALALINVVALRQTRLVLGCVTVCGPVKHFSM